MLNCDEEDGDPKDAPVMVFGDDAANHEDATEQLSATTVIGGDEDKEQDCGLEVRIKAIERIIEEGFKKMTKQLVEMMAQMGTVWAAEPAGKTGLLPTVWEEMAAPLPHTWSPVTYVGLLPAEEEMLTKRRLSLAVTMLAGMGKHGSTTRGVSLAGMEERGFCTPPDRRAAYLRGTVSVSTDVRRFRRPPDPWYTLGTAAEVWKCANAGTDERTFRGPPNPSLEGCLSFGLKVARPSMVLAGTNERFFRVPPNGRA